MKPDQSSNIIFSKANPSEVKFNFIELKIEILEKK